MKKYCAVERKGSSMKNVLFIRSNPVNPDSRVEKETACLSRAGYNVTIFGWDRSSTYSLQKRKLNAFGEIITIYRIGIKAGYGNGIKNIFNLIRFQAAIIRFLNTHKNIFDVIHACDFDTAVPSFFVTNKKNTRFVYDIFDFYVDSFAVPSVFKPLILAADKHIINNSDAVIICTEQRKAQIQNTNPKKVVVIHNSPPKLLHEGKIVNNSKIKIAYFGILSHGRLIEELLNVVANNNDLQLYIGGFGALEDIVLEKSKSCSNIKYFGRIAYDRVLQIEQAVDLMTAIYDPQIPNHRFAAPNKFYEALMLGKPLIMAKNTGMSEIVKDNEIGALIDYSEIGLVHGIDELITKRGKWVNMSLKMKMLYENEYSWSVMENRLVTLYGELIKRPNTY